MGRIRKGETPKYKAAPDRPRGRKGQREPITALEPLAGDLYEGEHVTCVVACNDYLRMGMGRSFLKLHENYREQIAWYEQQGLPADVPCRSLQTIHDWGNRFHWLERAALYDAEMDRMKDHIREDIILRDLAEPYVRINQLANLADLLSSQLHMRLKNGDMPYLWVEDFKSIDGIPVRIKRFNGALVQQFRGVLEDIAKETGGRRIITQLSGPNDGPIQVENAERLTREQLMWIAAGGRLEEYKPRQLEG